jgi:hypothetical protein
LIATRYFDSNINGSKEPDNILQCIPRNHDPFPWAINKIRTTHNPNTTIYYKKYEEEQLGKEIT